LWGRLVYELGTAVTGRGEGNGCENAATARHPEMK
jgi:hypothetical protein